jgi:peptide/nickel transport system ATP-binding protein
MNDPLLSVRDLRVYFPPVNGDKHALVRAVDGVSFDLRRGEVLAIVGETGSGKTTIARSLLGLNTMGATRGSIQLAGREMVGLSEAAWRPVRWRRVALAVQNVGTAFDPVYRVREQIAEPVREHLGLDPDEAAVRTQTMAERVGLRPRHLHAYPHQLSGGEKKRAMLAMALSCEPDILIADEPTSGQDVLGRIELIRMLREVHREHGLSLILITHDLAAAAKIADRVAVLYAGKLAEMGQTREVLEEPRHPYTWGLLHAYPNMTTARDLRGIRGRSPDASNPAPGCRFHPRCTQAVTVCREEVPSMEVMEGRLLACHLGGLQTLVEARGLRKAFSDNTYGEPVTAVQEASLRVCEGEVVALVGETGSGKTTLGRMLVGLLEADAGHVIFEGQDLSEVRGEERKILRRRIQFIAQDPFDAVSPRLTVTDIVREPLDVQGIGDRAAREETVHNALHTVGLPTTRTFLGRRAHELSGGQLQRVAIARALVLGPKLLVADEPVSMLDASECAKVMNLLKSIQNWRGMGMLLVSHDLALVRKVADRILVMREGEIVERGPANRIVTSPQHAYTRALVGAAPALDWLERTPEEGLEPFTSAAEPHRANPEDEGPCPRPGWDGGRGQRRANGNS